MINLNSEFIKLPLVFSTSDVNRSYCDMNPNYIFMWDSKLDKNPVYLIKDTKKMEHRLILRMHSQDDFITKSIEQDVINKIKELMFNS